MPSPRRLRFCLLAAAVASFLVPRTLTAQAASVASDSVRLQGSWSMVAGAADGYPLPPTMLSSMRRELAGRHLLVTMAGRTFFEADLVFHPDSTPAMLDYHMTAGPTAGGLQLGIYRWAGDTVEFAFAATGRPRATTFGSTPGDGQTWSRWVRRPGN